MVEVPEINEPVIMTKDDLTKLDNYGHRRLEELTEAQLNEYATLLQMRQQEVLERLRALGGGQHRKK